MIQVVPATNRQAFSVNESADRIKASDMFKPIITFMKICGTYSKSENRRLFKLVPCHFGYCLLVSIVVIVCSFKYFSLFGKGYDTKYKMVGLVTFAYFYCCVSCFCLIFLFHNCKYLTEFLTAFDKYVMDHGTSFDITRMSKRIQVVTIVIACLLTSTIIFNFPILFFYEEQQHVLIKSHLTPFDECTGLIYYIVGFLNSIVLIEFNFILFSNGVFQLANLYTIRKEFSSIAKEVKKSILKQDFDRIFSLRQQHESLCELMRIGNPILQQNAAYNYVYGIPIVCMMLYGVTTRSLDMVDVSTMAMLIGFAVIGVFSVTIMGAQHSESAHEPFQELFKVDVSKMTQLQVNQIQMFISRLSGPTIGVSVYGLFVIGNSTILMMMGTIISYAVIVIQLNLTPTCLPMRTNITGT